MEKRKRFTGLALAVLLCAIFLSTGLSDSFAAGIDITGSGDPVIGVPDDGNWPGNEAPPNAIDDDINTKYLHFGGQNYPTGLIITVSNGSRIVQGLSFTTANDAVERDPVAYEFYGSNSSTSGPWVLIASGRIADFEQAQPWPRFTKNQTPITFANATGYRYYQLMLTEVRAHSANSMQIAEIELLEMSAGGAPPQVDAGPDKVLELPYTSLQLDGTVTDDGVSLSGEPTNLVMEWSVESAPEGVVPEDVIFTPGRDVEKPLVAFPAVQGLYVMRLWASDGYSQTEDTMQVVATESLCPPGDLDGDCVVDILDLCILADHWLEPSQTYPVEGDIDGKDGVNLTDYSLLSETWDKSGPAMVISEFMAVNSSKPPLTSGELLDEDFESSDWIELYNASSKPIDLDGWYLTDDPEDLTGWRLPEVTLEPRDFLTVFASGKDRTDPEGTLHTDFTLPSEGGFLALVRPDGKTIVHSYDYPPQFSDVSYGLAAPTGSSVEESVELVPEYADAFATIPVDDSLGLTWTYPDFDPINPAWLSGKTGVGYDYGDLIGLDVEAMAGKNRSVYIRIPFEVSDLTDLMDLRLYMKYEDGFIAYLNDEHPIQSANADNGSDWNAGASAGHSDSEAVIAVEYPLPEEYLGYLRVGTNVLAIHGLNYGISSTDLLILPRLTALRRRSMDITSRVTAYFFLPTPDYGNGSGHVALGPRISDVTENPIPPDENQNLPITARVDVTYQPVDTVTLHYRIGFDAEKTIVMKDDGLGSDMEASDGMYTAVIPASAYRNEDMVRWYVTAQDAEGVVSREPMFLLADNSPEYFGTVVNNPAITTNLGIFQYFVQNTSAEGTRTGTRASVFYQNEFYDNVFIRLRGGNTTHGRKVAFNDGHFFRFSPDQPRVDEINLNETGAEPTYVRQVISWESYEQAGQPASISFPLHVRRNGSYFDIRIFVEQPDTHLIEREGLNPRGALYKVYSDLSRLSGEQPPRKISRLYEDMSDLQALINGVSPSNPQRNQYVFDNVNIPAVINFLAVSAIVHENDHTHKNFFLYRDTEGTGEWMFLPWDKDLTFGINFGIGGIIADQDWPSDPLRSPSHPFFGDSTHQKIDYQWNRLFDAIHKNPVTRKMYVRRLRTLMDLILQPDSTPLAQKKYENRIDELAASYQPEKGTSLLSSTALIKTQYLPVRRQHFYENHSIHNPSYPDNAGIPDAQPEDVEIHFGSVEYSPASANQDQEYIQLLNPNSFEVDMSGWTIAGGVTYTFQPGTVISANGILYVSPNVSAFRARLTTPHGGQGLLVQGNYKGHLSSWGETLTLYNDTGVEVDSLTYEGNPSSAQRYLRITELMYHPTNPEPGSPYTDEDFEYIEMLNIGTEPLLLQGIRFSNGILYSFPTATLAGQSYLILAKNPDAFALRYSVPEGTQVFGPYDNSLSNGGEAVKLDDSRNNTILSFTYKDGWYDIADGTGFSLTIRDPYTIDRTLWDSKAGWRPSAMAGGSPGFDDSDILPAPGSIVINEVLAHSHATEPDWIELYNTTDEPIHIGGWFLSDDASEPNRTKYEIAEGAVI
ncbi:MAG: lamin tail domain-containing protein, partial [Sedimentisphaerales bacterium]|nr:lamin tail domain-containing protein [Sedimentisphaerales bacterium]